MPAAISLPSSWSSRCCSAPSACSRISTSWCCSTARARCAAARASEERWRRREPLSPLDGVPTSIKDTTPVKGWPTRYGCTPPTRRRRPRTRRSSAGCRAAGMAILGKSTTPEFGWKALTDSPLQGTTRSPWNPKHSPGGSSGGASSMTAAGVNPFNHGNDGGGSIRIPAAHTGLVGLKPSLRPHPAISRRFAVRRRDQPGRAGAQRARHGDGAERHGRSRSARLALAAGRARATTRSASTTACAAGASASASTSAMSRPIPRCARWSQTAAQALRGARRACRGRRSADRAAAEVLRAAVDRQLRHPPAPDPDAAPRQARSGLPRRSPRRAWRSPWPTTPRAYEAKSQARARHGAVAPDSTTCCWRR